METLKMDKLFESYTKQAAKFLVEDEEDLVDEIPGEDDIDVVTDDTVEPGDEEEVLELDLANPVCPSCGAVLVPVGGEIDTDEEDEDGNPIYDEDEADAIDLLQGLGYVVYKPVEEDVEDDADLDDDDTTDDDVDDVEDEDDDF